MPNEGSPELANRVVALHKTINRQEGNLAVVEPGRIVGKGPSRAALYLAHIEPLSQELPPAPEPERAGKDIWSSAIEFIMEGLTACGTSMYPSMAYFNAGGGLLDEAPPRETVNERRVTLTLVANAAPIIADDNQRANRPALSAVALRPQEMEQPPQRWNWLTSCWEVVVAIRTHMRRERQIREAMDALAELDDFTLKDIGIHHRGQIEHAVRYRNDC